MERDARVSAEEARLEAETASRAKSDFLTVMGHELRTPLNAIMGYAVLLADGVTGPVIEAQRTQLTRIHASARHLLALIDDMLALSRLEIGREQLHLESADIVRLTSEQAALVDPTAAMKGLFVRFDCAHEGPLMLSTDPTKVRQILLNLLSNAIKFTHRGGVRVTLTRSGNDIVIAVTDSGIGIAPDHLERVFEAFWQVDLEHSRIVGGTGLGLDVSRRLARLLGGELIVRSELGTGSTFELTLPWRPPD
jgi:signal transduction histidine kinase